MTENPAAGRVVLLAGATSVSGLAAARVLAAAGAHKVGIIRAAAQRRLVDTLITDDVTAELLLGEEPA